MTEPSQSPRAERSRVDVVVVGAGFSGMYLLHRLRKLGLSVRVFDRASDVGGTWYWNRYPGARCDVESMQYSYSFSEELQQEWKWSERFSGQPEILDYARHVAQRFDLRQDIEFNTTVESAVFDEESGLWNVTLDSGEDVVSRYCVMATGCLSTARTPDFEGLGDFQGDVYHTGHWPHTSVDLSGLRVSVIGTGSSAIQTIPVIAEQADELTVFQRTPNYSIPSRNGPMPADYESSWKDGYAEHREAARHTRNGVLQNLNNRSAMDVSEQEREETYERRWESGGTYFMAAFEDLAVNQASNDTASEFVRDKIRDTVSDPATAELLAPYSYPIGTKRICVDTQYFETFNRANVTLVDVRTDPIERISARGVVTGGREYECDAIVFATGFDAMTGTLMAVDIRGRDGLSMRTEWEAGPRTYLGLMSAGFPNLFMVTGPGSPSVLSNMMVSIEQHVDWIVGCIEHVDARGASSIEARVDAQDEWVEHVNEVAYKTLYPKANSWYMGANIPGKPSVFLPYIGGVGNYREKCDEVAANGFVGFDIVASRAGVEAAE
jgi:cyclohexanone monooxygenase